MRKLKMFGLALAAVFAVSGIAAASAFATYDWEDNANTTNEATLKGESTGTQYFLTNFGEVECEKGTFSGTEVATTTTEPEGGERSWTVEHVTVHPVYDNCHALGFEANVKTEGCNYTFTPAETTEGEYNAHAIVDIVCEGTHEIEIIAAGGLCSVDVPPQTNAGTVKFKNEGSGSTRTVSVTAGTEFTNEIEYTGVGGFCSGGPEKNGKYMGTVPTEGKSNGNQVGIWVT